ncbi:MAG: MarR family transcriptional regulator [Alphaproteobacteria bacterium]
MANHKTDEHIDADMLDLLTQDDRPALMATLFQTFVWFDRNLQQNLVARGWPPASRTESQLLLLVGSGVTRQKDIARILGLTPQAINQTSNQLIAKGLIALEPDPDDRRQRIIVIPPEGLDMHLDAVAILAGLEAEIAQQIGGVARMGRLDELLVGITLEDRTLPDQQVDRWSDAIVKRLQDKAAKTA